MNDGWVGLVDFAKCLGKGEKKRRAFKDSDFLEPACREMWPVYSAGHRQQPAVLRPAPLHPGIILALSCSIRWNHITRRELRHHNTMITKQHEPTSCARFVTGQRILVMRQSPGSMFTAAGAPPLSMWKQSGVSGGAQPKNKPVGEGGVGGV